MEKIKALLAIVLVFSIFMGIDSINQKPVKVIDYTMKAGESVYSVLSEYSRNDYNVNTLRDMTAEQNPGISIANVDAGKTTLSEAILHHCGTTSRFGRVDHEDSFLDYDPYEREKGITGSFFLYNWPGI